MRWIKDHTYELIIISAIVLILGIVGACVWFRWTHTCITWEEGPPTGRYCTAYTTIHTSKSSSTTQCVAWQACRSCTRWVEDDSPEIPKELDPPTDRCP